MAPSTPPRKPILHLANPLNRVSPHSPGNRKRSGSEISPVSKLRKLDDTPVASSSKVPYSAPPAVAADFWSALISELSKAHPELVEAINRGISTCKDEMDARMKEDSKTNWAEYRDNFRASLLAFLKLHEQAISAPLVPEHAGELTFLAQIMSELKAIITSPAYHGACQLDILFLVNTFTPAQLAHLVHPFRVGNSLHIMQQAYQHGISTPALWETLDRVQRTSSYSLVYGHAGYAMSLDGPNNVPSDLFMIYIGSATAVKVYGGLTGGAARAFHRGHLNQDYRLLLASNGTSFAHRSHHYDSFYGIPSIKSGQVIPTIVRKPPAFGSSADDCLRIFFSVPESACRLGMALLLETLAGHCMRVLNVAAYQKLVKKLGFVNEKPAWRRLNAEMPFLDKVLTYTSSMQSERGKSSVNAIKQRAEESGTAPKWGFGDMSEEAKAARNQKGVDGKFLSDMKKALAGTFAIKLYPVKNVINITFLKSKISFSKSLPMVRSGFGDLEATTSAMLRLEKEEAGTFNMAILLGSNVIKFVDSELEHQDLELMSTTAMYDEFVVSMTDRILRYTSLMEARK